MNNNAAIPDAELLLATGCAHCPVVLDALSQLIKQGLIGRLEIHNIVSHPERAQQLNVRSVPWCRIGKLVFEGQYTAAELKKWAAQANTVAGQAEYISEQLKQGHLHKLEGLIKQSPELLDALIPLLENPETEMQVRIGVDAIFETFTGHEYLQHLLPELARLSVSDNQRIRSDITHYLTLTGHPDAIPFLEQRLNDEIEEIRETAREGLAELQQ